MNTDNKFSGLTIEELKKRKKNLQSAIIGLGIAIVVTFVLLIFFAVKSGNYALIAVGSASLITLIPSMISLNQLNSEIKSRN